MQDDYRMPSCAYLLMYDSPTRSGDRIINLMHSYALSTLTGISGDDSLDDLDNCSGEDGSGIATMP